MPIIKVYRNADGRDMLPHTARDLVGQRQGTYCIVALSKADAITRLHELGMTWVKHTDLRVVRDFQWKSYNAVRAELDTIGNVIIPTDGVRGRKPVVARPGSTKWEVLGEYAMRVPEGRSFEEVTFVPARTLQES